MLVRCILSLKMIFSLANKIDSGLLSSHLFGPLIRR
jgi:hypothetical protein